MRRLIPLFVLLLACNGAAAIQKPGQPAKTGVDAAESANNKSRQENADDELPRGEMLYKNHCRACHESNAHVREKRRAKSFADILSWVTRWSTHLDLGWSREDINEVAQHLDKTYYKFSSQE